MRSIWTFVLALLVGATAVAAPTPLKLALNWKAEPQFGGFYAAQVGGHFKKHGLDVTVVEGGAGTPVVQMVAAGQMDFGIASADEVVISRARGADVVALFAAYQTNPQGIMVHEARGFKTLADVYSSEGTLALQKGLPYAMFLAKKYSKPKAAIVPYTGGVQNFVHDPKFSQQCFVTSEPLTARKAGAKPKTFLVADQGYNPYTTVLITRTEVLKKNPKLAKALVEAVRAGWREYLDKPAATNEFMGKLNKSMDAATFEESAQAQKSLIETEETKKSGLGVMTETRWKELGQQMLDLKLIDKAPEAKACFTLL
ncbi:MAG: ABC transporter substrate-binding protein [Bdellovibrionota bacterium]